MKAGNTLLVVNASEDDEVTIILADAKITNKNTSPINIANCDKTKLSLKEDTFNEIIDEREAKEENSKGETTKEASISNEAARRYEEAG